jgi:hypothetical protein
MFFESKIEKLPFWLDDDNYFPYYLTYVVKLRYDESIFYFTWSSWVLSPRSFPVSPRYYPPLFYSNSNFLVDTLFSTTLLVFM